jgi:orotate phosphoribosyltransferase
MASTNWLEKFRREGAIWEHRSPVAPHIKTSLSGLHTDAYFNSDVICARPELLEQVVESVVQPRVATKLDWVVSIAPYGLFFTYACARLLGARCAYTNPGQGFATSFPINKDESVLVVSDDVYSGDGVRRTVQEMDRLGAKVLSTACCLANLSGLADIDGREIVAAATVPAKLYPVEECPLCKAGSEALLSRPNWTRLMAGQ